MQNPGSVEAGALYGEGNNRQGFSSSNEVARSYGERSKIETMRSDMALKVTLLGSEWSSSMEGLPTINRQLAISLAKHSQVEVTLLVPQFACSEEEKRRASSHNVSLREAQRRPGYADPLDWLSFPPRDQAIDIVLGHGVKLGKQAQFIRESHHCTWIQVVHTAPEELVPFKYYPYASSNGNVKNSTEVELCQLADAIITVGLNPTKILYTQLRSHQSHADILSLTPGTFREYFDVIQAPKESKMFKVLIFGRGDPEEFSPRGYDIAARAIAALRDTSYNLIFVGAAGGKEDEVALRLIKSGIERRQLFVRSLQPSRERLKKFFSEADLLVMPSRTEGFGLTALEALSAGLPILVSGNSGFGKALWTVPLGKSFVVESEDPKEWAKAIAGVREKERSDRLHEIQQLRTYYEEKFSWEKQCDILVEKMWDIAYASRGRDTSFRAQEAEDVDTSNVIPSYVLARGAFALEAYQRGLQKGRTFDKRTKILLIGQDRVGKTSLGKSLRGEQFNQREPSTDGVKMMPAIKNASLQAWKNRSSLDSISAFDHKCAEAVTKELLESSPAKLDSAVQCMEESVGESTKGKRTRESGTEETKGDEVETESTKHGRQEQKPEQIPKEVSRSITPFQTAKDDTGEQNLEQIPVNVTSLVESSLERNDWSEDDSIWPVLWDFAGQAVYHAIHPIFLSQEAIYVLVLDLTRELTATAQCRTRPPDGKEKAVASPDREDTNLDHIIKWLDLVHSLKTATNPEQTKEKPCEPFLPPVILVGTHADEVRNSGRDPFKEMNAVRKTICEMAPPEILAHIRVSCVIDNTKAGHPDQQEDSQIISLRRQILELAEKMPHTKKEIPLQWLRVEEKISEMVRDEVNYVTKKRFQEDVAEAICHFDVKDDIGELLHFLQARGTVVYHDLPENPNGLVVLNPQWLINTLNMIITVDPIWEVPILIEERYLSLKKNGLLSNQLLNHAFEKLNLEGARKDLLHVMEKFDLICDSRGCEGKDYPYIVPCMLTETRMDTGSNDTQNGPLPVFLTFSPNYMYVPSGLFCRLIVFFWEWVSQFFISTPALCANSARFKVSDSYHLTLEAHKTVISLKLWTKGNSSQGVEERLCKQLLSHLERCRSTLQSTCQWLKSVSSELSVQCTLCKPCPDKCGNKPGICILHKQRGCGHFDCGHYISLRSTSEGCKFFTHDAPAFCLEKLDPWTQALSEFEKGNAVSIMHDLLQIQSNPDTAQQSDLSMDLKKTAADKGFMVCDNSASGDCMFYALSHQLQITKGIEISHRQLRYDLVQFLERYPNLDDRTKLFNFVHGYRSWIDYLRSMEKAGTWGDHVILYAAANCYKTCIRVISSLSREVMIIPNHPTVNNTNPLVVGHIHARHYVSLQPRQGSATVNGVKDDVQNSIGDPPDLNFKFPDLKDLPTSDSCWSDIELPVDILLLTVEDCEFLACFHYLNQPSKSYHKSIGYVFYGSMGHDQEKKLKTALVKCTRGSAVPSGSLIVVNDVVRALGPKAVFSVGTCIGLTPKETRVGDVVVSSKLTTLAHKTSVSRDISNLIRHAADGWRAPLKDPQARKVNVKCDGTVLSIPPSQASSENIIQKYSKATAVEVEGEGVFAAAHHLKIEWVVVKGIKCYASENQSSSYDWNVFASVMAASIVSNILRNPGVFKDWSHYNEAKPLRLKLEEEKTNTRWNTRIMVAGVVVLLSVFIAVLLHRGWIGS